MAPKPIVTSLARIGPQPWAITTTLGVLVDVRKTNCANLLVFLLLPTGPLSLAASQGGHLVVAAGQQLITFNITSSSSPAAAAKEAAAAAAGAAAAVAVSEVAASDQQQLITKLSSCELSQQASALQLLLLPNNSNANTSSSSNTLAAADAAVVPAGVVDGGAGGEGGFDSLVAVGLWVENTVKLLEWPGLVEVGQVELEDDQPRSIGVLEVAGRPVLLVGSSRGMVSGRGDKV